MDDFKLNDRVIVIGKRTKGKIAFIGETRFAKGEMYGVILDEPKGKYSGTIGDVCYFKCPNNHATFVRACQLEKDLKSSSADRIAPMYPNYLKDSSSRHKLKTIQKCEEDETEIANQKQKPSTKKSVLDLQKKVQEVKDSNACSEYIFAPVYPSYLKENSSKHKIKVTPKIELVDRIANPPKKLTKSTLLDDLKNPKKIKDNNNPSKDLILSVKPNYLKDSSSEQEMKINPKRETKANFVDHNKKPTKSSVFDHPLEIFKQPEQRNYQLPENYQKGDVQFNTVGEIRNNFSENLEIKMQNIDKNLGELSILKQKLSERNGKIDAINIYMRKLKTYMKWSQHIEKCSSDGDSSVEDFPRLLVDSVLKQIEDNVDQISDKNQLNLAEDSATILEENNFLRLYVDALGKRNEVLFDSLKYARNILQRALIRSRSKKKCRCIKTSGGEIETECKYCLSKLSSTIAQSIEHETQMFLESNPIKNSAGYSTKVLGELEGYEKLEKYLESLLARQASTSTSENVFQNNLNAETLDSKDLQYKSALNTNDGIPSLSQSATKTDVSINLKNFSRIHNRNATNRMRSTSLLSSRKAQVKKSPENRPAKQYQGNRPAKQYLKKRTVTQNTKQASINSVIDPKKDSQELNSEIKTGITDKKKSMEGGLAEDILIIPMNKATEEKLVRFENKKLNAKASSLSQTEVARSMKPFLYSGKFNCEKRTKRSRSESAVTTTAKEPFKF